MAFTKKYGETQRFLSYWLHRVQGKSQSVTGEIMGIPRASIQKIVEGFESRLETPEQIIEIQEHLDFSDTEFADVLGVDVQVLEKFHAGNSRLPEKAYHKVITYMKENGIRSLDFSEGSDILEPDSELAVNGKEVVLAESEAQAELEIVSEDDTGDSDSAGEDDVVIDDGDSTEVEPVLESGDNQSEVAQDEDALEDDGEVETVPEGDWHKDLVLNAYNAGRRFEHCLFKQASLREKRSKIDKQLESLDAEMNDIDSYVADLVGREKGDDLE